MSRDRASRLLRATRWPGGLAERWLLPWAAVIGLPPADPCVPPASAAAGLAELWGAFTAASDALIATVAGRPPAAAAAASVTALRRDILGHPAGAAARAEKPARKARGERPTRSGRDETAAALQQMPGPPPGLQALADTTGSVEYMPSQLGGATERAAACLDLAAKLMSCLRERKLIRNWAEFWALPADLGQILAGNQAIADRGRRATLAALNWEPVRDLAVRSCGTPAPGTPVAPGAGCGPCVLAGEAAARAESESSALPPRPVIVAAYPLPQYAPLLMGAAGLVTRYGSEAAHLISVARSLGVPAVTGCDLLANAAAAGEWLAAVDGNTGMVWIHAPA